MTSDLVTADALPPMSVMIVNIAGKRLRITLRRRITPSVRFLQSVIGYTQRREASPALGPRCSRDGVTLNAAFKFLELLEHRGERVRV